MSAQAISSIGDWLSIVAVITLVGLKWEASPMQVSLVFLCLAVPMALLGPVAGMMADRFNRKGLMIGSDLVRAGLILMLSFAETLWMIYLCLFVIGLFSALFVPAKNGKLKEVVGDGEMKSAMSITSMIDSTTKVMGPLLSGVLVAAFGAQIVFIIDSATFILSAALLFFLPKSSCSREIERETEEVKGSFKKDILIGFSFIKSNRFMLVGMFFLGMSMLVLQLSDSQIIVLLRQLTSPSPDLFGYAVTAAGVGMFLSGLVLTKKTDYTPFSLMLLGVCGIGLSFGMMALLTYFDMGNSIVWVPLTALSAGFTAALVFVPFQAAVQVDTPVHMTGRVFGVINSVMTTATIIGPLLGGWLSTVMGVIPTFIITGLLLLLIAFSGWVTKQRIERREENVSESQRGTSEAAAK